ncbi:MAG: hypothetical protein J0M04_07065 [Verrucomicrobia bacterium]|nr:hypothetical protein [Verrucomicrobiota bacterium]
MNKEDRSDEVCARAVAVMLEGNDVDEAVKILCAEGFPAALASRALTFLPSAFARLHHEPKGIQFPSDYYAGEDAHGRGELSRYDDDPIYQAALRLGTRIAREDEDLLLRFVEISAEDNGIAAARARGLNPTSISTLIHEF